MGPVSEAALTSFGGNILVQLTLEAGFSLGTKAANDLVFSKPLNKLLPLHDARLETTAIKELIITLKYKLTMEDAQLGFFRSSVHGDSSLFSSVKDYLSIEKGWFSPYLFASARRPVIPRTMKPDVIFCHGPFLAGERLPLFRPSPGVAGVPLFLFDAVCFFLIPDLLLNLVSWRTLREPAYLASLSPPSLVTQIITSTPPFVVPFVHHESLAPISSISDLSIFVSLSPFHTARDYSIGETLYSESASVITLCNRPIPPEEEEPPSKLERVARTPAQDPGLLPRRLERIKRSRCQIRCLQHPVRPLHLRPRDDLHLRLVSVTVTSPASSAHVIVVVGLKPHRSLWTTSKRPGESVIRYLLLNGCISILVPVKPGAPLLAWDSLTLEKLWEVDLPPDSTDEEGKPKKSVSGKFEGIVKVLYEYLDLCVDWERVVLPQDVRVEPQSELSETTDTVVPTPDDRDEDENAGSRGEGDKETQQQQTTADGDEAKQELKHEALRDAVSLLVASAIRSKDSKAARKDIDADRAGIAMWRIR
ncbi:hypothetical protein NMY22_g11691 [Coprinellus aureogranulatus]|nr:hypothetical protein NMY22_g11691 [Coprinellus aureogranulatus]